MDYEKCFEDELDDLSDLEDEEEELYQQEKDDFLAASIAQLKRDLNSDTAATIGAATTGVGDKEEDGWGDLMASIQKTTLQLEAVSFTIDSHVEMTPRPDDEGSRNHENEDVAPPPICGGNSQSSQITSAPLSQIVSTDFLVSEEVREEVRDMLFEMVVSVEYILSLSLSLDQTEKPLELSPPLPSDLPSLAIPPLLETASEFEEPAMLQGSEHPERDEEVDDLFVYDQMVDVDSSHKRKFEIAMSATELAMREKEEEYARAIEEDRLRREERRRRRLEAAQQHAQARAATTIQAMYRCHCCQHLLAQKRLDREEAIAQQRVRMEQLQRDAEAECRRLLALEEEGGEMLRAARRREEEEAAAKAAAEAAELLRLQQEKERAEAAERLRLQQQAEEERQAAAEAARLQAEEQAAEEARLAAEKQQQTIQAEKEAKEKKAAEKEAKEKKAAAIAAHKKNVATDKSKEAKLKKPSWGGFIQKTLFGGGKKEQVAEEEGEGVMESLDRDEEIYDEYFVYSDDDIDGDGDGDHVVQFGGDAAASSEKGGEQDTVNSPAITASDKEPLDLLPCRVQPDATTSNHIELHVQTALNRSVKEVQFTQEYFPTDKVNVGMSSELGKTSRSCSSTPPPLPLWVLAFAFEQWRGSPPAKFLRESGMERRNLWSQSENKGDSYPMDRQLDLSVESLTDLQTLRDHSEFHTLNLNVNAITRLDDIGKFAANLLELSLNDNKLRCVEGLRDLPHLRVLSLDSNQLETLSSLEGLTELEEVSANMNLLTSFPPLASPALHKLELYGNQIAKLDEGHLHSLQSLAHLNLGRNQLTHVSGAGLSQCPLLSQLILSQNRLTEVPSPLYLPNLRSLWLSHNKLTSLDAWVPHSGIEKSMSSASWPVFLPLLEKLHLNDNQIISVGAYTLATSPYVMLMDLSFNSIRDFSCLAGIVFCQQLQVLHVGDNPVDKERGMAQLLHYFLPVAKEISGQPVSPSPSPPGWGDGVLGLPFSSIKPFILSAGDELASRLLDAEAEALRSQAAVGVMQCNRDGCGSSNVMCQYEKRLIDAARRTVFQHCSEFSLQGDDLREQERLPLLMSLGRMSSEHRILQSKERVHVAAHTSSQVSPSVTLDLTLVELCRSHLIQLLHWSADSERVLCFSHGDDQSRPRSSKHPSRGGRRRRRGSTKEALWRQEARHTHAALRLQACARGFLLRRKMKRALRGAAYEDDELEAMWRDQDGLLAEYGSILDSSQAPELSDGWLQTRRPPSASTTDTLTQQISHQDEDEKDVGDDDETDQQSSIVYGDHKRRRRLPSTPDHSSDRHTLNKHQQPLEPFSPDEDPSRRRSPRPSHLINPPSSGSSRNITATVNEWVSGNDFTSSQQGSTLVPPLDSASFREVNIHRPPSTSGAQSMCNSRPASRSSNLSASSTPDSRFGGPYGTLGNCGDDRPRTGRSSASSDWGGAAHSQAVAAMISARGKRQKEEQHKDPTVRFEAFQKKQSASRGAPVESCRGNTSTSGSFGGRPKAVRKTAKKGKKAVPAAWLRGKDEDGGT